MAKCPATQLSLRLLRRNGWQCQVVEHWNPHVARRHDAFGFADILAYEPTTQQIALVQTTSYSNFSARYRKVCENEHARGWLESGGIILLHGWKKPRHRWECREESLTVEEIG